MFKRDGLFVDYFEIEWYYAGIGQTSIETYEWHKRICDNEIIKLDSLDSQIIKELFT